MDKKQKLYLVPFAHILPVKENVYCLLNALTLKKFYCDKKTLDEILKNIKENRRSDIINKLIQIGFISLKKINKEFYTKLSKELIPAVPKITTFFIILTNRCNFNCEYCYVEQPLSENRKNQKIDLDLARKIINVIKNNAVKEKCKVYFYGGEPLLNKEIMFFIIKTLKRELPDFEIEFSLVTNGSLLTRSIARALNEYNVSITVSLDGWEELNDCYRKYRNGAGTYKDILHAISILKKEKIPFSISCTVHDKNYLFLPQLLYFFKRLGAHTVGFNIQLDFLGKNLKKVDMKELAFFLFEAFKVAKKLKLGEPEIGEKRAKHLWLEQIRINDCAGCGNQIFFSPDGKIGPCQAFNYLDQHKIKLKESFDARKEKLWIEWGKRSPLNMPECYNCEAIGICGGGCPYNSFIKYGTIWKPDKEFCIFIKSLLRLLVKYYYHEQIEPEIQVKDLETQELDSLSFFYENMKREDPSFAKEELIKVKDPKKWGIDGIIATKLMQGNFTIAKAEDRIIGFCFLFKNSQQQRFEIGLGVLPEYQNKGIASRMLKYTLAKAYNLGIKNVFAVTKKQNVAAKEFFSHHQFAPIKSEKEYITFKTTIK